MAAENLAPTGNRSPEFPSRSESGVNIKIAENYWVMSSLYISDISFLKLIDLY
jgi:hypothetical protein